MHGEETQSVPAAEYYLKSKDRFQAVVVYGNKAETEVILWTWNQCDTSPVHARGTNNINTKGEIIKWHTLCIRWPSFEPLPVSSVHMNHNCVALIKTFLDRHHPAPADRTQPGHSSYYYYYCFMTSYMTCLFIKVVIDILFFTKYIFCLSKAHFVMPLISIIIHTFMTHTIRLDAK